MHIMLDETVVFENMGMGISINGEFAIYHIIYTSVWRPCWFSNFGVRWEYFTILFEILTDENAGIDTKTSKYVDGLIGRYS